MTDERKKQKALKTIRRALSKGGLVNTTVPGLIPNGKGESLLHAAIYYNELTLFKKLLKHKADIHARDDSGRTPLIYAALFNHHPMVKLLLHAGADPDQADHAGQTALHWLGQNGGRESAELLLSHGADMYALDNDKETAMEQTYYGQYQIDHIASVLLKHGFDLKRANLSEGAFLQQIIAANNFDAVTEMIKRAPALSLDECNACLNASSKKASMMKIVAPYVHAQCTEKDTPDYPLFDLIRNTENREAARLLVQLGADVQAAASSIETLTKTPVSIDSSAPPDATAKTLVRHLSRHLVRASVKETVKNTVSAIPDLLIIAAHILFILVPSMYLCITASWAYLLVPGVCIGFLFLLIPKQPATGDIQGMGLVVLGLAIDIFLMAFMTVAAIVTFTIGSP